MTNLEAMYKLLESCCDCCREGKPCAGQKSEDVPAQVQHCVRSVSKRVGDVNRAFAICVSAGQKHGTLKPGTLKSTAKGKKADRSKRREADDHDKMAEYERLLKRARKHRSESMGLIRDMMALIEDAELPVTKSATKLPKAGVSPPNVQGSSNPKDKGQIVPSRGAPKEKPIPSDAEWDEDPEKIEDADNDEDDFEDM